MKCVYANKEFGTRICGLKLMPVTTQDCNDCMENAYRFWYKPLEKVSDNNDN